MRLIKTIEEYDKKEERKSGRPAADRDNFIKNIKKVYEEHIGPATLYEEGPFFQVVRLALEFVGLPSEYPTKSIRAAFKEPTE